MDLSHLWLKTKETFICFYMEKIKTQDSVDENGRKNAYHGNTRAGACLEHRENGSEPNLKKSNTGGGQEQLLQREDDVSTLPVSLVPTRDSMKTLGLRYSTILLNMNLSSFLHQSSLCPNFHYKALCPVNLQQQYSTWPHPRCHKYAWLLSS